MSENSPGAQLGAVPGLHSRPLVPSSLRSLQPPWQGLPPVPPDLTQHVTDKLHSLSLKPIVAS